MADFVGLDVSLEETSVCVVDDVGKVLCERKVRTEPEDITVLLTTIGGDYVRIGATDADTKLVPSWLMGGRDSDYASAFIADVADRLANRVQLTSDGHKAY